MLELARHGDQALGGRGRILARDRPSPGVGARAAVGEHPPRQHQSFLAGGLQLGQSGELLLVEKPFGQLQLRLDVGLLGGGADR